MVTDADELALYEDGPYTLAWLTEEDVLALASGLANLKVKAMARLALSGDEELERNSQKPVRKKRPVKPVAVSAAIQEIDPR